MRTATLLLLAINAEQQMHAARNQNMIFLAQLMRRCATFARDCWSYAWLTMDQCV